MNEENKIIPLDFLFKHRNIAMFVAKQAFSFFIEGLLAQGFNTDNLYLISPSEEKVLGIKCYKSINDIPSDTIDLLILTVTRNELIKSLRNILDTKQVNFIHFFGARTGEYDDIGLKIEDQLNYILRKEYPNTKAIGPNCMGVYCPMHNSYSADFPSEKGFIALTFHSGDLHSRVIRYGLARYNLKFSKGGSIGNCVSLQVSDFIKYFNQDEETEIIALYYEGFSRYQKLEGRELFKILKDMRKPVLFLRGGKSNRGKTAVLTHTGSLGSDEKIWQGVYKQTPLIEVGSSIDEMIDYLFFFNNFYKKIRGASLQEQVNIYPKGKNALVIIWSGGIGIIDTDTLSEFGLNMPLFDGETKERLQNVYNIKVGSLSNPLDLPWIMHRRPDEYVALSKAAISENIDLVIMHTDARRRDKKSFDLMYDTFKIIRDYVESLNKILILILPNSPTGGRKRYYQRLIKDGFLVYSDLRNGLKAFLAFYEHGKKLKRMLKKEIE